MNLVLGAGGDSRFVVSDSDERGAAWRVAKSGLPSVVAGLIALFGPPLLLF